MGIVEDPITGTVYEGTVKRVMDFGAFIEILPGKEGLCHISRLYKTRVEKVTDVVHEGDKIKVKLLEVDRLGRLNLAAVDALDENGNIPMPEHREDSGDGSRGERRPYGDRPQGDRPHGDRPHGGGDRDRGPRRDDSRRR
jgi:polyribonucleotide nucleotidyltransferase